MTEQTKPTDAEMNRVIGEWVGWKSSAADYFSFGLIHPDGRVLDNRYYMHKEAWESLNYGTSRDAIWPVLQRFDWTQRNAFLDRLVGYKRSAELTHYALSDAMDAVPYLIFAATPAQLREAAYLTIKEIGKENGNVD